MRHLCPECRRIVVWGRRDKVYCSNVCRTAAYVRMKEDNEVKSQ